jgi:hypothetical protein
MTLGENGETVSMPHDVHRSRWPNRTWMVCIRTMGRALCLLARCRILKAPPLPCTDMGC